MYSTPTYPSSTGQHSAGLISYARRAEAWLDARGRGAWIAAMIAGFVLVWPVGLALLGYMIWSKRMFSRSRDIRPVARPFGRHMMQSSGNRAFDAYKEDTLRRLQEEQDNFEAFLARLRDAKDKAEFDQFMADRSGDTAVKEPQGDK
ncbi:DUF2852 domain-containing protein [Loktanella salsilacus]|uniref:DUF2852 domain-containing protein n=1 Tax=Loktanella salsilacus TaxID=195913 RepID=UPI003736BDE5